MTVTPTQLRANLYKLLDQVIATHKPIEILCKGQIVKLVIEPKKTRGKLSNIKAHPGTLCVDPDSIVHMDWSSQWQKGSDL